MMSKAQQFKNAMLVYAAELMAAQEFWAFRLLNLHFTHMYENDNKLHSHAEILS